MKTKKDFFLLWASTSALFISFFALHEIDRLIVENRRLKKEMQEAINILYNNEKNIDNKVNTTGSIYEQTINNVIHKVNTDSRHWYQWIDSMSPNREPAEYQPEEKKESVPNENVG